VPLCAAMIHPEATAPQLDLTAGWLVWGTYADDYFPAIYGHTRDMAGAKVFYARLAALMPDDPSTLSAIPATPVERGLADLWARTAGTISTAARNQFRHAILDMLESWLWELTNQIQNRIADPIDYVEMRRKTFGSALSMSLPWLAHGHGLPPELLRTRTLRALENSASDYAALLNDIFSYQKEIEFEGELHNGVLVVQHFLDVGKQQGVQVVNELITARVRQFEHVIATELPTLITHFGLDTQAQKRLRACIERLQEWMASMLLWHQSADRYKESELRKGRTPGRYMQRLTGPTGLGTSAARIASLLGRGRPAGGP
jgi:germacradienol/geosmin synthase